MTRRGHRENLSLRHHSAHRRSRDWEQIERGLKQRIFALNISRGHLQRQKILKDKVVPEDLVLSAHLPQGVRGIHAAAQFGATSPAPIWCATATAVFTCLRTTCAAPRASPTCWRTGRCMKRTFPQVFDASKVRPVDDYPQQVAGDARISGPGHDRERRPVGVLTPGIYNSAYFEHSFLSQQMGVELVEGRIWW